MGLSAFVAVVSLAMADMQATEQKNAMKKQERAQQAAQVKQEAKEKSSLAQSRRQQLREERVRRAKIIQRSQNLGVGQSSGAASATGPTQFGSNIGFQTGQGLASQGISTSLQSAQSAGADAQTAGANKNLAMNVFSSAGGFETIFTAGKNIAT